MATNIATFVRPIPAIVTDLATNRQRIACNIANDGCDREWDRLTDRRDHLERELKAAIYQQTGVSWDILEGVIS